MSKSNPIQLRRSSRETFYYMWPNWNISYSYFFGGRKRAGYSKRSLTINISRELCERKYLKGKRKLFKLALVNVAKDSIHYMRILKSSVEIALFPVHRLHFDKRFPK